MILNSQLLTKIPERCVVEFSSIDIRAVHGSGQVGFGPNPDSTRLNRVIKITTRNRPDIWDRPGGSGHQLIGSDWSVWRVWAWASIWAEFVILHNFFF